MPNFGPHRGEKMTHGKWVNRQYSWQETKLYQAN